MENRHTCKSYFKKYLIIVSFILFIFGIYAQYIKSEFDTVYKNRDTYYHEYNTIYNSGNLDHTKLILKNYCDTIHKFHKNGNYKIYLSSVVNNIEDSLVISFSDQLLEMGFNEVNLYYYDDSKYEFEIKRTFLTYKKKPTHHYLIYSKRYKYKYPFKSNDNWFFYSSDGERNDYDRFLDFRPMWCLPYFEAFDFFYQ